MELFNLTFYIVFILVFSLFIYKGWKLLGCDREGQYYTSKINIWHARIWFLLAYGMYIWLVVSRNIDYIYAGGQYKFIGGIDAYYTKQIFDNSAGNFVTLFATHGEIGYKMLMFICYKISTEFSFFLFVFHTMAYLSFIKYLKLSSIDFKKNYFMILIMSGTLFTMFNTLRNDFVAILCLISMAYLRKNDYLKSLLVMLLGLMFHKVAIFGLLVIFIDYMIRRIRGSSGTKMMFVFSGILAGSCVGMFFVIPRLFGTSEYSIYLGKDTFAIGIYLCIFMILAITLLEKKYLNYSLGESLVMKYQIVFIIGLAMFFVQTQFSMAYRVVIMFLPIIYEYCFQLIEKGTSFLKGNNIVFKALLYMFIFYKIYDLFFVQLQAGQIIN